MRLKLEKIAKEIVMDMDKGIEIAEQKLSPRMILELIDVILKERKSDSLSHLRQYGV